MIYLIVFLSLLIRFISIDQSLWLDEATSALVARMPVGDIFTKFLPGDFHPPLYYVILKYWSAVFGYSEVALRIPSVIFGIGTVYLTFLIAKKLFDRTTGLIAAVFLATSGLSIYYSQEARMYSLAAMLVSATVYLFLRKRWLLLSITLVLVGMADYVSLFIVPVFFIAGSKEIRKVGLTLVPLVLAFLFWSPVFSRQLSGGLSLAGSGWWNTLGLPTFKNLILIPVKFILGRISIDNNWIYGLVAAAAGAPFAYLLYRARRVGRILWMWLATPIILGFLISLKIPILSHFRFLFCLPALYILTAAGLEKLGRHRNAALGLILLINLLSSAYYLATPRFQREDWRAAASAIGESKVVLPSDSQKEALIYYGKGGQIVKVYNLEPSDNEVWLSRYVWELVDPMDATRHKIEGLGYNKAQDYNFNGVVFYRYTKNRYASSY